MGALDAFQTQTYYGENFMQIIGPDINMRAAKKQIMFQNGLDIGAFNKDYWTWKHNYRRKYSEAKMIRYGYKPIVYEDMYGKNPTVLDNYMSTIDPAFYATQSFSVGPIDLYAKLANYLQWNGYNYSITKQELNISGTIYYYQYVGYLESGDPAIPDDTTIGVGHFESGAGDKYTVNFNNDYNGAEILTVFYFANSVTTELYIYINYLANVPFVITNDDEIVMSPIVPIIERGVVPEETINMKHMLRKMGVKLDDFDELLEETDDDGEQAVDNAYVMTGLPMKNPYEILAKDYDSTEASQQLSAAFMKELEKEGLYEENANGEGIYTVTAKVADEWRRDHYREQAYLARALFKSFAYYAGAIDFPVYNATPFSLYYIGDGIYDRASINRFPDIDKYSGHYYYTYDVQTAYRSGWLYGGFMYDISIETKNGVVRADEGVTDKRSQSNFHYSGRTYVKTNEDGDREYENTWDYEGYNKLMIRVQKNETQYQEMIITGLTTFQDIEEKTFWGMLQSPPYENRLVMPHFILQELRFTEYATVYDHSFLVYAFMKKEIEPDWGKIILGLGVMVVVCVGSLGSACSAGILLFNIIVSFVIQGILASLLKMIDSDILKVLAVIAFSVLQGIMTGGIDMSAFTAENYLILATELAKTGVETYIKIQSAEAELEDKKIEKNIEAQEGNDEKIDEASVSLVLKADMSSHYSFKDSNSPDAYYAAMLGDGLFNYEQFYNVDGEIEIRKQVTSG